MWRLLQNPLGWRWADPGYIVCRFIVFELLRWQDIVFWSGRGCWAAVHKEGLEYRTLLPLADESLLLVGVLDGGYHAFPSAPSQMALNQGVKAGNRIENGAPSGSALFVGVESGAVPLLRPAPLCWAQVQARLVVFGAHTTLWFPIITWLVVDMAEIATGDDCQ